MNAIAVPQLVKENVGPFKIAIKGKGEFRNMTIYIERKIKTCNFYDG